MPPKHPLPWKIVDTGTGFKITDRVGRALAHVYYRLEDSVLDNYLHYDDARRMAEAIMGLSAERMSRQVRR